MLEHRKIDVFHRHGSNVKMAAWTAAFEFSEKINGCECEGVLCCGQRLFGREICFATENERADRAVQANDKRCVYCILQMESKTTKRNGGFEGGQRNDFRKQKLKGFSFVRILEGKMFSRIAFSDNI